MAGDSIGINGQGVFIRLAKDGEGYGCRAGRVIINLDIGHNQAAGGGEGQEDKAEGEEEGRENAARFHLGDFLSCNDVIKNALAVKSERKELIHDIHNGMMGSGRFAVGGGAVLCRFGVGCRFVNGIHGQNQNGQGNGQQNEGVASGQGGKAKENGARGGAEQGEAGEEFC